MFVHPRQFGVALFIAALSAPAYAGSITPVMLEAYTGTVAGTNTCGGGGEPDAMYNFFGGVGFGLGRVNGQDTGIGACGMAGSISDMTSATGPLSSSSSLNNAGFVGSVATTTYTGAAAATADYGTISASASGILTGEPPAAGVSESVAFGLVSDSLNISGTGSGYIALDYTMSGSLSVFAPALVAGGGTQEVEVQVGTAYDTVFYGQSSDGSTALEGDPEASPLTGCSSTTSSFTCTNATFGTRLIPITFGTATAYNFGLIVSAWPENSTTVDPDITLTGIQVYDSNQQSIADFSITSGSGTTYGADGLESGTPEPGTWLLAGCALIGIGVARRRMSRDSTNGGSPALQRQPEVA